MQSRYLQQNHAPDATNDFYINEQSDTDKQTAADTKTPLLSGPSPLCSAMFPRPLMSLWSAARGVCGTDCRRSQSETRSLRWGEAHNALGSHGKASRL